MNVKQSLKHPFGISVFGSASIRTEPDIASIVFGVTRLAQEPQEAFTNTRNAAQKVSAFLSGVNIHEFSSSRVTLAPSFTYTGGESKFEGYRATINFSLLMRDLDRIEEILVGVVNEGVNQLGSIDMQTTRLKEVRAEARRRAIKAAQDKAENYCNAAGVKLGAVLHIEDINPDTLNTRAGHTIRETPLDDEGPISAVNPGSILVNAAVMMGFTINVGV